MTEVSQTSILVNGANGVLGDTVLDYLGDKSAIGGVRRMASTAHRTILIDNVGNVDPKSLHGIQTIINCAGCVVGTPNEIRTANVEHAQNLARIAKIAGVRKFLQVSSFSIFGRCDEITDRSPIAPNSVYGQSKRDAENALNQLADREFIVVCVRLPFMFGRQNPALMGRLIDLLNRLPFLPVTQIPSLRSMITYTDAAELLLSIAEEVKVSRAINLADPQLFDVRRLIEHLRKRDLRSARPITIPNILAAITRKFVPSIGERLFSSSVLNEASNWAADRDMPIGIHKEISALLDRLPLLKHA
jgi:nucleoside-diphosphate-sugar epimerase